MTTQAQEPKTRQTTASAAATNQEPARVSEVVADKAHEAVDRVAETAARTEDRLRAGISDASGSLSKTADQVQERGAKTVGNVKQYVDKNPIASLGIAFAAGLIISSFVRK